MNISCIRLGYSMVVMSAICNVSAKALQPTPADEPAKTDQVVKAIELPVAAGHWEGAINLPTVELEILVNLRHEKNRWTGGIDIPVQGLRGFALGNLKVERNEVSFKMPKIPGDPTFVGRLSPDGKTIAGKFSQAGTTYDFNLTRTAKKEEEGVTPARGIPGTGFTGIWQGSLHVSVFELRLLFKLKGDDEKLSGTMDSIDQNAKDIPITEVTVDDRELKLELDSIGGEFEGTLSEDGSEISGKWQQGGQSMSLVIKRLAKQPDLSRPQDPKPPYPYHVEEVAFTNAAAEIELAGTFTFPKSDGAHPVAVLISGSGPQDRDEAIMGHRPFLVLADHLTRNGIAVLRYDDRGVGKSQGSFSNSNVSDFTSDALAAVEYLKSRKEVDAKHIGLIGHSEGGITAPRVAVQSDDVSFIVMLAGVGVPMEQLLVQQTQDLIRVMGGDQETMATQRNVQQKIFAVVRSQDDDAAAAEKLRQLLKEFAAEFSEEELEMLGFTDEQINAQIKIVQSPWFRELLAIDPRPTLTKVKCPVLALNGSKDVQVAAKDNLTAIETALKEGGNNDVTTVEFPDLNHLFQKCKTGAPAEYGAIEETINPEVLTTISDWIMNRTLSK